MKKGFTLVELLAVIVILAIIALIAVPIFLGMINGSRKSSEKESINLYTDTVEKTIQKKQLENPNFNPDKCEIQSNGNLECFSGTTSLGTLKVNMKGDKPTSGTVIIEEDDIKFENIVLNGVTYYETNSNTNNTNTSNSSNEITFTYNGVEFHAEEGMTWEEFLESDYNTTGINFFYSDAWGDYMIKEPESNGFVSLTDEIKNGIDYYTPSHSGGSGK